MADRPAPRPSATAQLAAKIARLVREKGWSQQEFAAAAKFNRHTARKILEDRPKWLRADTVKACARALGLSVDELHHAPLPVLVARVGGGAAQTITERIRAQQPELAAWLEANPRHDLSEHEINELASVQGTGGPLTMAGVEEFVERVRRKRRLLRHIEILAGTSYLPLLEELADLMLARLDPTGKR
jgi:transcriptional regulator with XRE-family HTH domain